MLESMVLALWVATTPMPEGCAVTGTVFYSTEQTHALLNSNCLIDIQRHNRRITMTSPQGIVVVEIPTIPGKHQFAYFWGSPWALFGAGPATAEWVAVSIGRRTGA